MSDSSLPNNTSTDAQAPHAPAPGSANPTEQHGSFPMWTLLAFLAVVVGLIVYSLRTPAP
jgi:hypothetical protein